MVYQRHLRQKHRLPAPRQPGPVLAARLVRQVQTGPVPFLGTGVPQVSCLPNCLHAEPLLQTAGVVRGSSAHMECGRRGRMLFSGGDPQHHSSLTIETTSLPKSLITSIAPESQIVHTFNAKLSGAASDNPLELLLL